MTELPGITVDETNRIASLGAFFYLVMDIIIHFGVFWHLREEIDAKGWVLLTAIALDAVVLAAFAAMKWQSDPLIVLVGIVGMGLAFSVVRVFLGRNPARQGAQDGHWKRLDPPITGGGSLQRVIGRLARHGPRSSPHGPRISGGYRDGNRPGLWNDCPG